MNSEVTLTELTVAQRVAYHGALFSMAYADGVTDKAEIALLLETLDMDGLPEAARSQIRDYLIAPPSRTDMLAALRDAPEGARFGLVLQMIEIALADDEETPEEKALYEQAARTLSVSTKQMEAMKVFAAEAKRIRERGLDDEYAADALKAAGGVLAGAGIPLGALYFSGSIVGLSAAGITSGLAALGLGLGMVGGIGFLILIGAGLYFGVTRLLDIGGKRKRAQVQRDRERKAQLAIKNLQDMISHLADQVASLQHKAADAEANRQAIEQLTARLRALKQLLNSRKTALTRAA